MTLVRLLAAVIFPENLKEHIVFTRCRLFGDIQTRVLSNRE